MTENFNDPQFDALKNVINEIASDRVPLVDQKDLRPRPSDIYFARTHELSAQSIIMRLQLEIDERNALDDSDLIDVLYQSRIEIKYMLSIIDDLRGLVSKRDAEIRLHLVTVRAQQQHLNTNAAEIQRLENELYRAK